MNLIEEMEHHWTVRCLLLGTPLYQARIDRPVFETSPYFETYREAEDWIAANHPEDAGWRPSNFK